MARGFGVPVVGESHYQDALAAICKGCGKEGVENLVKTARLIPESDNPYDRNAVCVEIEGRKVGYLSRENALAYRKLNGTQVVECEAAINGGWNRGPSDRGNFGVTLDYDLGPAGRHQETPDVQRWTEDQTHRRQAKGQVSQGAGCGCASILLFAGILAVLLFLVSPPLAF